MDKNYTFKKGISLVVLIITIIIMLILASAVIISVNNTNIIKNTNETVFKNNVQIMVDNYKIVYDDVVYGYFGDESLVKDEDFQDADIILSDYTDRFIVDKYGIIYTGTDENEKNIVTNMGIRTSN